MLKTKVCLQAEESRLTVHCWHNSAPWKGSISLQPMNVNSRRYSWVQFFSGDSLVCSLESFAPGGLQVIACAWTLWDSAAFISSFILRCEDIWITRRHIDCWSMVTNMMNFSAVCSHGYQTWLFCDLFLWSSVKGTIFMP